MRDLKLEGLGRINLLVGNNNSGKTSVLEALSIFCDSLNWRRWSNVASAREVGGIYSLSQSERLAWLFPQGEEYTKHDSNDIAEVAMLKQFIENLLELSSVEGD
jgi:AAA15 family ATPase/GTPase